MDIVVLIAERKIQEAIENGDFNGLAQRGYIDCSLQGEAFLRVWWSEKIARDDAMHGVDRP